MARNSWADRSERGVLRRSEGLGEGAAGDWTPLFGGVPVVRGGLAECVEAALEAVARSVDGEDFGVVEEPVEDGGGGTTTPLVDPYRV